MRQLDGDESIVQLYNTFEDTAFKYLIMEVCKGGDLFKAMLLRGGKMDEHWTCNEVPTSASVHRLTIVLSKLQTIFEGNYSAAFAGIAVIAAPKFLCFVGCLAS